MLPYLASKSYFDFQEFYVKTYSLNKNNSEVIHNILNEDTSDIELRNAHLL